MLLSKYIKEIYKPSKKNKKRYYYQIAIRYNFKFDINFYKIPKKY